MKGRNAGMRVDGAIAAAEGMTRSGPYARAGSVHGVEARMGSVREGEIVGWVWPSLLMS